MRLVIAYLVAFFIVGLPATIYAQPKPQPTTPAATATTPKIGGFTIGDGTVIGGKIKVGDTAKNMKVLPPWTMRKCPKDFFATYNKDEAKQLKLKDNDCYLWNVKQTELSKQVVAKDAVIEGLKKVHEEHKAEHKLDEKRIQDLMKQVKDEIAEKNKYKYKPSYNWLYISIGAAVAIAGIAFGTGVWLAKKE
jgi:hypothetical protein